MRGTGGSSEGLCSNTISQFGVSRRLRGRQFIDTKEEDNPSETDVKVIDLTKKIRRS